MLIKEAYDAITQMADKVSWQLECSVTSGYLGDVDSMYILSW